MAHIPLISLVRLLTASLVLFDQPTNKRQGVCALRFAEARQLSGSHPQQSGVATVPECVDIYGLFAHRSPL
jgi:hypothetical protein